MGFLKEKISEVFNKDKWEVKTLGEIIRKEIFIGDPKITPKIKGNTFPIITGEDVANSTIFIDKCKVFTDKEQEDKKILIEKEDLLMIVKGFPEESLGKPCVYLGDQDCVVGNNIAVIKHSQNSKYLAHLLSSNHMRKQMRLMHTGTENRPYIKKADILKIKLLLPDLETQNKIAEFLDKFVHLKSELVFEKEKRMKQFEHYRNSIFGRNEEEILWEIRSLEEIATEIYRGVGVRKEQLETGNYPAIKAGDVNTGLSIQFKECISFVNPNLIKNKKYFEYGDVLISNLSSKPETLGRTTVYLGKEKCLSGEGTTVVKHNQNPKYLSYALSGPFVKIQIKTFCKKGSVCNFLLTDLKKLRVPLPDLETQNEIANSLSRFIELSSEIDCELKLTNTQYEYYKESIFGI